MVRYPVVLEKDDNHTLLVSFPDFPEAHTFGDSEEEALTRAVDALETVIDAYIRDRRPVPAPSLVKRYAVTVPALIATKVGLHNAMREQGVTKAELTKRLGVHPPQVDRLLDIRHGSQLDQLEAAAQALGRCLDVTLSVGSAAKKSARPSRSSRTRPTVPAARASRPASLHAVAHRVRKISECVNTDSASPRLPRRSGAMARSRRSW